MDELSQLIVHLTEEKEHVLIRFNQLDGSIIGLKYLSELLTDNRAWFTSPISRNGKSKARSVEHLDESEKEEHVKLIGKRRKARGPWKGMNKAQRSAHARWLVSHRKNKKNGKS